MKEINLINSLEKISSEIPNKILKIEGYVLKQNCKEKLEIIIFKGISSSTTHPIEFDLNKEVIEIDHFFTNFKLYNAPLTSRSDICIKENQEYLYFLNQKNWV